MNLCSNCVEITTNSYWGTKCRTAAPNKGQAYRDETLYAILNEAPTRANCERFAKALGRSPEAIEQIYMWARVLAREVKEKRPDDIFVAQVKRAARQVGWVY